MLAREMPFEPENSSPFETLVFDYKALDSETRIVVQQRTNEIKSLMRRTSQDIIEIGEKLIEVKERLEHGRFESWVKTEFEWALRTANRFISVAKNFKSANLADLPIAPSALYELAAPSTPEEVRQEVVKRAQRGEKITYTKAMSLLEDYKPKVKTSKRGVDVLTQRTEHYSSSSTSEESAENDATSDSSEEPFEKESALARIEAAARQPIISGVLTQPNAVFEIEASVEPTEDEDNAHSFSGKLPGEDEPEESKQAVVNSGYTENIEVQAMFNDESNFQVEDTLALEEQNDGSRDSSDDDNLNLLGISLLKEVTRNEITYWIGLVPSINSDWLHLHDWSLADLQRYIVEFKRITQLFEQEVERRGMEVTYEQ